MADSWLVEPLHGRRRYARRPHFYRDGHIWSLCEVSIRTKDALEFDPETGRTLQNDPRLGCPQVRRPCMVCTAMLQPGYIPHPAQKIKQVCAVCGSAGYWVGWVAELGEDRCTNHLT